jgi:hypothetical protein
MNHIKTFSAILASCLVLIGCSSKSTTGEAAKTDSADSSKRAVIPVKVMLLAKTKIARTID